RSQLHMNNYAPTHTTRHIEDWFVRACGRIHIYADRSSRRISIVMSVFDRFSQTIASGMPCKPTDLKQLMFCCCSIRPRSMGRRLKNSDHSSFRTTTLVLSSHVP
ncbi:hypothetical protein TNCV_2119561, partial [Trichonephila clavipes]